MKQLTHILAYRDIKGGCLKLFGPFVSEELAATFSDELPDPLEGGSKLIHPLQRFEYSEAHMARDEILASRPQ